LGLGPWLARLGQAGTTALAGACGLILGVCCVGGLAVPVFELGYRGSPDEEPLLEFVKQNHRRGDVYMIPADFPAPWNGRPGVFSSNFTPPPRTGQAGGFIAIDLQRFRLATGAPIYVDFKAIPYKDTEVLEWYQRMRLCTSIYTSPRTADAKLA